VAQPIQYRIMQNGNGGWYWEAVTADKKVVARGVAETHSEALADAEKTVVPEPSTRAAG
jgi:hypothetical protein